MICSRVLNLLSAYVDRELTGEEMLHIRDHLDSCPECDREHAHVRQVKLLLGSLSYVEPRDPFNGAMLQARPRRSRMWLRLRYQALCLRESVAVALRTRLAGPAGEPDGRILPPVALGGALALALVVFAIVQQPQSPDAVTARVPEAIPADAPLYVYSGPSLRVSGVPGAFPAAMPHYHGPAQGPAPGVRVLYYEPVVPQYAAPLPYPGDPRHWQSVESR